MNKFQLIIGMFLWISGIVDLSFAGRRNFFLNKIALLVLRRKFFKSNNLDTKNLEIH